jgi:hypothetical protein
MFTSRISTQLLRNEAPTGGSFDNRGYVDNNSTPTIASNFL